MYEIHTKNSRCLYTTSNNGRLKFFHYARRLCYSRKYIHSWIFSDYYLCWDIFVSCNDILYFGRLLQSEHVGLIIQTWLLKFIIRKPYFTILSSLISLSRHFSQGKFLRDLIKTILSHGYLHCSDFPYTISFWLKTK